ncbi:flavin reductase family protein [Azospirillum sp. YIM DDC1]|uniref:Flavin reductase family protein n=1 Tax=Azospirillum aestuarii TaxID=2802052 RepID=A0ABS1I1F7_9PROT|nr:flavin reductase family protein [Azospirillum aestuarii]MBK4720906.1 flavin reductase family protein [Azospirillum aestuarii]TWA78275.1 flavin reductase (DIM6/NTAB) family NADH-FMN oxidoreductase RutF [Azospirillum brasilense]
MQSIPVDKANRFLEPGPIVLVTTIDGGKPNIMTMGFHMMVQHDPPLVGCVIGPWDYSYGALRSSGECVIAIPTVDLARTVVDIGNCSGATLDKFRTFELTPLPARKVTPPLIGECLANLECRVADTRLVETHNLFILEVVAISTDPERRERRTLHHRGDGSFVIDGKTVDLRDRMVKWRHLQD